MANYGKIPYHIRSFLGGQSDFEDKGIAGSYKHSQSADIRKKKDTLSCQQAVKDDLAAGGSMTAIAYFIVPASDGNTYFFCFDGKIFKRDSGGTYTLVYTETSNSGQIVGAAEWYDISGYTYLVYATTTVLHVKRILGPSYTNAGWGDVDVASTGTWPKTNLEALATNPENWHTMKICNGELLITNNNKLALVGYDFSYTNNAVTLIPGNIAHSMVERGKYSVIACNKVNKIDESALFAWDGLSLSWNDKQIIKVSGINSLIDTEVALMQVGPSGQLYISDLRNPLPIRSFNGGGITNPDGVASYKGIALFGVYNNTKGYNGIWSFGRLSKNSPLVLNYEYPLPTATSIGSVSVIGTDIIFSYQNGSGYGVKIIDTANKATCTYQSLDLIAPLGSRRYTIPLERVLEWTRCVVECDPIPTGCKIECWYRLDKILNNSLNANADSNGWVQANLEDGSIQAVAGQSELTFFIGEKSRVIEMQFILIPSGNVTPEINEYNIYFDAG